ncbi:hypothetical protein H9L13_02685 [Sphingomonas lutea]|uniref:Uncharacterized protein n=1 Tax=Sphingomonas lutea TaxID=1045317 RepID=A0A7G9SJ27_9SPHN|nr:hypothetical protein [Sphingomonas lutea]QNN67852.1 hypothetical protein H9L13_02685 [Sphingomonas lutea]
MKNPRFIEWQWRTMRWTWVIFVIAAPVLVGMNFITAASDGDPLPWMDIPMAVGIVAWGTAIMWLARRWFNFMAGSEVCRWRRDR